MNKNIARNIIQYKTYNKIYTDMIKKSTLQFMRAFSGSKYFLDLEDKYGCHNYKPLDVVIARAEGIHVWDCEGSLFYILRKEIL